MLFGIIIKYFFAIMQYLYFKLVEGMHNSNIRSTICKNMSKLTGINYLYTVEIVFEVNYLYKIILDSTSQNAYKQQSMIKYDIF